MGASRAQALLHTYFAVDEIAGVAVRGLAGRTYTDKVDGGALKTQEARDIALPSFVDRVHHGPTDQPGADKDVLILARPPAPLGFLFPPPLQPAYVTTNAAFIGGEPKPVDVVVWNPYAAASPGDLPPPAYRKFVCVEPGLVAAPHSLPPRAQAVVSQKIVAV